MIHWSWGTRLQCAVTRLENVRQSNIRTGKKLGFQLPHRHPHQVGITIHWPRLMYQQSQKKQHLRYTGHIDSPTVEQDQQFVGLRNAEIGLVGLSTRHVGLWIHSVGLSGCRTQEYRDNPLFCTSASFKLYILTYSLLMLAIRRHKKVTVFTVERESLKCGWY